MQLLQYGEALSLSLFDWSSVDERIASVSKDGSNIHSPRESFLSRSCFSRPYSYAQLINLGIRINVDKVNINTRDKIIVFAFNGIKKVGK
ncbi:MULTISPECIES: hypothetical protein [Sphingobacterium]|uniref:hypothetical protein n=1 Tax=Sphingobacterium TaxID=28453 RepID=UPI0013DAB10B|nr:MULTISPECIES: hypothetical protein [unclassified Sphingobacterium]